MKFVHMNIWLLKRSENVSLINEKKIHIWSELASGLLIFQRMACHIKKEISIQIQETYISLCSIGP